MTIPAWPLTVGFTADDLQDDGPDLITATEVDAGPAITRRRATAGVRTVSGKLEPVPLADRRVLEMFYRDTAGQRFSWIDPADDQTRIEARFVKGKPLSWTRTGGLHVCALTIEILP